MPKTRGEKTNSTETEPVLKPHTLQGTTNMNTQEKDNDSQAKVVTPTRKEKPVQYWSFHLNGTNEVRHFDNKQDAMDFKAEWGPTGMIKYEKTFKLKTNWEKHKNATDKEAAEETAQPKTSDIDKIDAVVNNLSANQEVDRVHAWWFTTSSSYLVCFFLSFIDMFGEHAWHWKPSVMIPIIQQYFKIFVVDDPVIAEAIKHLRYGPSSDPKNPDKEVQRTTTYTKKGGKVLTITHNTAYTFISLPIKDIAKYSVPTERQWVENKITKIIDTLKSAMRTNTFAQVIEKFQRKTGNPYLSAIYDPSKTTNFKKFVQNAGTRVENVKTVTDHVVQPVAIAITTTLYKNSLPKSKYSGDDLEDDTDIAVKVPDFDVASF